MFRSLWLVAIVLIVFGILLGLADWSAQATQARPRSPYRDGILYRRSPRCSRSSRASRARAASSRAGLVLGYSAPAAARYAFLLAIPAVFGSGLLPAVQELGRARSVYGPVETAVATVVAFVVGALRSSRSS